MGRVLLITLAALGLGACQPSDRAEGDPHADLSCAACHAGPRGERGRATVPTASCTTSGCHETGGPTEVRIATVSFPHRDHAPDDAIALTCAGCHTHTDGEAPLEASVDACALCHVGAVASSEAQECRLCHAQPDHSRLTSQGVAVSHSQLPWIEIGCVRCHYDVAEAETAVSDRQCMACHEDLAVVNERAVGRDLHPIHGGLTCTACHTAGLHEVRAMSSVVELVCSDCHREAHDVAADLDGQGTPAVCADCHDAVHAPQQRLILGVRPDGGATPSGKFLAGITCRSCHVSTGADPARPGEPIRGQATACVGCHEAEYAQVLDWWIDGTRARLQVSTTYVRDAAAAVALVSDSAAALVESARAMVDLVAEAGGHHNLELSDRLMREAVTRAREAYSVAGITAPTLPDLGRVPHSGMCSYCHYRSDEPWDFGTMPADFHGSVFDDGS